MSAAGDAPSRLLGPYAFGTGRGSMLRLVAFVLILNGALSPPAGGGIDRAFLALSVVAALGLLADLRAIERGAPAVPRRGEAVSARPLAEPELATLGLAEGASLDDIKAAYRRVAKECHPDARGDARTKRAEAHFAEATAAYRALVGRRRRG